MRFWTAAAMLWIAVAWAGASSATGYWQFLSSGREDIAIYSAGDPASGRAVVVVHDWFGITQQTRAAVDHLSELGYHAAAVNLYDGEGVETHAAAWELMQALDAEKAARRIDGAIDYMSQGRREVALMGFSMGVPHAIDAASRNKDRVAALAVWYGDTSLEEGEAAALGVPVLAIYGELDGDGAGNAEALESAVGVVGGHVETFVAPGMRHAFAQPLFNGGENYDEDVTVQSWILTEDFFARLMSVD